MRQSLPMLRSSEGQALNLAAARMEGGADTSQAAAAAAAAAAGQVVGGSATIVEG